MLSMRNRSKVNKAGNCLLSLCLSRRSECCKPVTHWIFLENFSSNLNNELYCLITRIISNVCMIGFTCCELVVYKLMELNQTYPINMWIQRNLRHLMKWFFLPSQNQTVQLEEDVASEPSWHWIWGDILKNYKKFITSWTERNSQIKYVWVSTVCIQHKLWSVNINPCMSCHTENTCQTYEMFKRKTHKTEHLYPCSSGLCFTSCSGIWKVCLLLL